MSLNEGLITRLWLKITLLLTLRYSLMFIAVLLFILGMATLIFRVVSTARPAHIAWFLLVLFPAGAAAFLIAIRRTPAKKALRAVLDEKNCCGGLFMAGQEIGLDSWHCFMPALRNVGVKWNAGRHGALFLAAMVFFVTSLLLPERYVVIKPVRPLEISNEIEQLELEIEIAEQENIISEDDAREYQQKLDELMDYATGYDPVKTWETLDHIREKVHKEADHFAETALSATESLAQMESLAETIDKYGSEFNPSMLSDAMSELAQMVRSNTGLEELLKNNVTADCLNACLSGSLTPEQLKDLLEALKECKGNITECMGRLCRARLVDSEYFRLCKSAGKCNAEDLAAFLKENAEKMGLCNAVSAFCQFPGKGGINRGRGDAPLTWTEGTDEQNILFKEQILPPASLEAIKESALVGVSPGAPSLETIIEDSGAAVLGSAVSGGNEAVRQVILPRHKDAVEKYFERK